MSTPRFHIVFAEPFEPWVLERARSIAKVTELRSDKPQALNNALHDCDALLVRSKVSVTREMLERATRLVVIGRGGVGLETIDLRAAKERNVAVVYTPCASTDAVADLTVGMILALKRHLITADAMVRHNQFSQARNQCVGEELGSLTLGIIGLGRIGRAVAHRCGAGFGMTVLFNDIIVPSPIVGAATGVTKEELYRQSDIVSLHVPLTDLTRHLINDESLSLFKRGAVLINTSRGEVIHAPAVSSALRSGALSGAGIDVFDEEPPALDHPLLQAPNTLLSPHLGARTTGALHRMNGVIEDVIAVLEGRQPDHLA